MFLSSLIEELCTKEEHNETGSTLTFRGQLSCITLQMLVFLEMHQELDNRYSIYAKKLSFSNLTLTMNWYSFEIKQLILMTGEKKQNSCDL